MPIHINLLAESQALEDLRRRDPVKRAIWVGACLGAAILLWSGLLQARAIKARISLSHLEAKMASQTNSYAVVRVSEKKLAEATQKLDQLQRLATNRFLNGTLLNALQLTTIDDVQLVKLKTDHVYVPTDEIKTKTNSAGSTIPGKPATVTEKITVILDARDSGPTPGDLVPRYKEAIAENAYFQAALGKTTNEVRLTTLSPVQPWENGRQMVTFTLECRYPEKTR